MRLGSGEGLGGGGVIQYNECLVYALGVAVGLWIAILHVQRLAAMAEELGLNRHVPRYPEYRTCTSFLRRESRLR